MGGHEKLEGCELESRSWSIWTHQIDIWPVQIRRFGYAWQSWQTFHGDNAEIMWGRQVHKTLSPLPLRSVSLFHCFVRRLDCLLAGRYTTDITGTGKRWGQCQRRPSPQAPLHRQSQKTAWVSKDHMICIWEYVCLKTRWNQETEIYVGQCVFPSKWISNFNLNPMFWRKRSTFTRQMYFQGFRK